MSKLTPQEKLKEIKQDHCHQEIHPDCGRCWLIARVEQLEKDLLRVRNSSLFLDDNEFEIRKFLDEALNSMPEKAE